MKLARPVTIGALQLIPGVGRTWWSGRLLMRIVRVAAGIALAALAGCVTAQRKPPEAIPVPVPPPTMPLPLLLQSLTSPESSARAAAAWQLARVKEAQQEVLSTLEGLRTDPDRSVRYAVAWALGHLRPPAETQAPSDVNHTPPRPKRITRPRYPDAAYRAKVEGTVVVALLIGEEGEVAHVEILLSVPALDDAALACVRQWQFEPMRVAGVPRATIGHAPVAFRIY
jgi:TonB family protein